MSIKSRCWKTPETSIWGSRDCHLGDKDGREIRCAPYFQQGEQVYEGKTQALVLKELWWGLAANSCYIVSSSVQSRRLCWRRWSSCSWAVTSARSPQFVVFGNWNRRCADALLLCPRFHSSWSGSLSKTYFILNLFFLNFLLCYVSLHTVHP